MAIIRPQSVSAAAVTGATQGEFREVVQFDPSGGTFTITMPASPGINDTFGVKNVTTDATTITISGGAETLEGPGTQTPAASQVIGGDGIALNWIYNGASWSLL